MFSFSPGFRGGEDLDSRGARNRRSTYLSFAHTSEESVADFTKRPLYTITSGDLGVDAQTVEERLSKALALATAWKAIVLIDEADVFLAQRNNSDLQRNGLVSG